MKLWRGFQQITPFNQGSVATIGNFDGVHMGHQALLKVLRLEASRQQLPMVVMLFEPQPSEYFHGYDAPSRLSSLRDKLKLIERCGVDHVVCIKFSEALSSMPAIEFADKYIFSLLQTKYLIVGEDFRFGHGRIGDVKTLQELGHQRACAVQTFPDFFIDNQRVSSTIIRKSLLLGDLDHAQRCLGRYYSLSGHVIHGAKKARQWGTPTANVYINRKVLPLSGVFCVKVKRKNNTVFMGVANIGCRPTVDGLRNVLEVHLFDHEEALYGEEIQVFFLNKLREEIKFSAIIDLIAQIHRDIQEAKHWFNHTSLIEIL